MTEDEAFIRAIVDGPGDDTPRLVYADWLDDRDDPRGAYLRAEWAAFRKNDIGGLKALKGNALAAGLDPVWAARVSRPPAGVCVEHIELMRSEPSISRTDLDGIEQRYGLTLPDDYRGFVLNYNGGVVVNDEWARHSIYNWTLYPLRSSRPQHIQATKAVGARSLEEVLGDRREYVNSQQVDSLIGAWYLRFVEIGHDPNYISGILLGVAGLDRNLVYVMDYTGGLEVGYNTVTCRPAYARSFTDFLRSLPRWRSIPD